MSTTAATDRINQLITTITTRASDYLQEELQITLTPTAPMVQEIKRLKLRNLTSIIGIEAEIRLLVAFSFDRSLVDEIFRVSTAGISVSADEHEMMWEESIAEMINIVVGNATGSLANLGTTIPITPPIVISEAKSISRHRDASFHTLELTGSYGMMSIHFVGPRDLFQMSLDYVENQ